MSERETFVARWSRRKRASAPEKESAQPAAPLDAAAQPPPAGEDAAPSGADVRSADAEPTPVPELPPIESIIAQSDVRAFLAPGVPAELTRAALRRAWSADPKIRDFIGLSENSWDFNDPGAIHGFGPLELTDELRREISRMMSRSLEEKPPEVLARASPNQAQPEPGPETAPAQPSTPIAGPRAGTAPLPAGPDAPVPVAQEHSPTSGSADSAGLEHDEQASKRRHGGALPQ